MKIVFTVHQFLPEYSAGTEILTYETALEFQKRGHDVRVFTGFPSSIKLEDEERFDRYVIDGIQVERFHHDNSSMGEQPSGPELDYNNLFFAAFFRKYLIREKPDVVHFFHLARLSASAIDVCEELGIPTVLTPTDFWFICHTAQLRLPNNQLCSGPDRYSMNCLRHIISVNQSPRIQKRFQILPDWLLMTLLCLIKRGINFDQVYSPWLRAFIRRADFLRDRMNRINSVALPTQLMGMLLTQNGLDPKRTFRLPFGLNFSHSGNVKRPNGNNKVLHLGYIGTLAEYKGVHVLVEAFRRLSDSPIQLKIFGKLDDYPAYVESLRRIARDDPRIEFCGTFPNSQIGLVFENLDVLVVPSLWYENTPLVIYTAQHARCPVIASDMAGMSEVIEHGKNGLLFEAGNVSELTATIENLLKDRGLLQKLSENAQEPLSIQKYVDRLLNVYNNLFKEAGRI